MAHPPELRRKAKKLRRQKMLVKDIAKELGVPKPTIIRWTNPNLEKRGRTRARRQKFSERRHCPICKKRMSDKSTTCDACNRANRRYWTRDRLIQTVREWALEHGHPPAYSDWQRAGRGHPAIRSITDGPNPPFKTWGDLMVASGFKRRKPRKKLTSLQREERTAIRRQMREDRLLKALAKEKENDGGGT